MRRPNPVAATAAALAACALFVQARTAIAETRHRVRGSFIEVDGVRLHYLERGPLEPADPAAPPLVLLHGIGSMIDDFLLSGLVTRAAQRYRVIAIDRPGYGRSSRPRDRLWTPGAQADLIHRALRRLDVSCPVMFGHSFGATVALAYALRYPVERLVAASGYYYPTVRLDAPLLVPPAIPVIGDLMRYTLSPIVGRALWPLWLRLIFAPRGVARRFRPFPAWMALRPLPLRAVGEDAAGLLPAVLAMAPQYANLRVPTVLVAGTDDRYVSTRAHSVRLQGEIRGSGLVLVPGAGHMVHHAASEAVMHAIAGQPALV
ncbi:MAG TPA: alpha/beta hydrolase [Burkholderiales bacterium]|nr:alpha/beta hydrolase [Burkholderiales bacterium]